jgi:hypothetical protein
MRALPSFDVSIGGLVAASVGASVSASVVEAVVSAGGFSVLSQETAQKREISVSKSATARIRNSVLKCFIWAKSPYLCCLQAYWLA